MRHADLSARIDAIEALMVARLHLPARGDLRAKLRAARGRLPRAALRRGQELVTVRAMLASPAAAGAIDGARVTETCAMLERHLTAIPEGKYRRRAWSALAGGIALQLLVVFALLVAVLLWRGLV